MSFRTWRSLKSPPPSLASASERSSHHPSYPLFMSERPRQQPFVILALVLVGLAVVACDQGGNPGTTQPADGTTPASMHPADSGPAPEAGEYQMIDVGPLAARIGGSVIWTGSEMIVWGGCGDFWCTSAFADGAAYDPSTDSWRTIAEAPITPRSHYLAAWTGSEMLIVGGTQSRFTAAAYSPTTDSWRHMPELPFAVTRTAPDGSRGPDLISGVWTGSQFFVWDPRGDLVAAYSPTANEWMTMPPTGLNVDLGVLRSSGGDVYALGALTSAYPSRVPLQVTQLLGGTWHPLPPAELWDSGHNVGALPRHGVWVDDRLIVLAEFGAEYGRNLELIPGSNEWLEIGRVSMSANPGGDEPLVIENRLLVFGGAVYDPSKRLWIEVDTPVGDAGRAVWTGTEVIFWGTVCCYGADLPLEMAAWRWTPPK